MIDLHHHCLPAVDDGPRDLGEAVALCAMAAEEGIRTIVATPHVLRGRWQNTSRAKLDAAIETLREKTNDTPHLVLGSEYYFAHDMTEVLRTGGAIIPLAGSRYVLVEFASHAIPPLVEQPFYHLQLDGWTPIIAHPERNLVFQAKPELLASLIRLGAKTQITTASLTGGFGSAARKTATAWLRGGMVHFLATDAHNTTKRPPVVREALAVVNELVGESVCNALTVGNPRAVLEGRGLDFEPEPGSIPEKAGFFSKLRRFVLPS